MTIIFTMGDTFYIEAFFTTRVSVPAGTTTTIVLTLEKPGTLLGAIATPDMTTIAADTGLCGAILAGGGSSSLTFGEEIAQVQLRLFNGDAGAQIIGGYTVLLMRRPGR